MANRAIEYVYKIIDQYTSIIKKMATSTKGFENDMKKARKQAEQMGLSIKTALKRTAMVGFAALGAGIAYTVKKASEMENVTAAFTPLMGGAKKATELVKRLNIEAATTPFQFGQISSVARQLLPVMNQDIDKTAKTFRMLGDTAGGNAQKLDSITRGYTKAMLKGKVDMESLNMIAEAGVPIFTEMAATMGYGKDNMQGMFKEISKGKVSTEMLTKVFERMTGEGGIFFKGMEISSKTLSGVWSTFKDNIALTAASIGQSLLPTIKDLVSKGILIAQKILKWVQANEELIKTKVDQYIKLITITIKTLWNILSGLFKILKPFIPIILGAVIAWKTYRTVLLIVAIAQWAMNAAMTANPIGLIIVAIGALIGLLILLVIHYKQVTAFTQKWWDKLKGLLIFLGPFGIALLVIVEIIRAIAKHWDAISAKFKKGDILGALKEIGKAILEGMFVPLEAVLKLIGKIPFMKGLTDKALEGIEALKTKLGLSIGEDKGMKTNVPGKTTQNVNVRTNLSVYTEDNMKVVPFEKRNKKLGYSMGD